MNSFLKKLSGIFYKNTDKATRILFFRFKKKHYDNNRQSIYRNLELDGRSIKKLKTYTPQIPNVGKNTYSAKDLRVISPNTTIGSFCSLGNNITLGHGKHPTNYLSTSPYFYYSNILWKNEDAPTHDEFWEIEPINIGNDVWIGDNVFVKNGVNISDGAIIGAKSIVTKDIPPYAIAVGNPARVIKYRFDENTIKDLLDLKWWNLDDEIIKQIPYDNIESAISYLKRIRQK